MRNIIFSHRENSPLSGVLATSTERIPNKKVYRLFWCSSYYRMIPTVTFLSYVRRHAGANGCFFTLYFHLHWAAWKLGPAETAVAPVPTANNGYHNGYQKATDCMMNKDVRQQHIYLYWNLTPLVSKHTPETTKDMSKSFLSIP